MKQNKEEYRICTKTIMDTSDPTIVFNEKGESDYYTNYIDKILPNWHIDQKGYTELMLMAKKIKKEGIGKDFDCIIGMSGGLDSSYTVHVAKEVIIKKNQNFFKLPLLQQWIADCFCLGLSLHRIFNQRQRIITKYGLKRSHTLFRPRSRRDHSFHRSLGLLSEQISKQMLPLSIFVGNLHGDRSLPYNRNHSSTTRHSR